MLPSIVDVANELGLECVERTRSKKEVYYRCPFCAHHNPKLSLNPAKNVFKCWHCGESGGVLDFEAKLTGKTFTEIKQQYFPLKAKSSLNARQRKKIGWHEFKKQSEETYKQHAEDMTADWQLYQFFMCRKYFAYLSVISLIDDDIRRSELVDWWCDEVRRTEIPSMTTIVLEGFSKSAPWQAEGAHIADTAFEVCRATGDFELADIVVNTAFLLFSTLQDEVEMWQWGRYETKFGHPLPIKNLTEARYFL